MLAIRKSEERGHFNHGWLDTYHTFSFADYNDPEHHQFRTLRVMNEDRVAPGQGFGMHPHRDMEIVTYVLEGELAHRDSLGNTEILHAGEFQRMSAGTGIRHSEFNPSSDKPVHLYQIWLRPERTNLTPSYEQRLFHATDRHNRFRLVASPGGTGDALKIHQDARVYLASLDAGTEVSFDLDKGRHAWVQILRGGVMVNGQALNAGDGVAVSDETKLAFVADQAAEILLFDLA